MNHKRMILGALAGAALVVAYEYSQIRKAAPTAAIVPANFLGTNSLIYIAIGAAAGAAAGYASR